MGELAVYTHSGKMGNGPWSIPIAAVPVTLLASIAYGYACLYNPFVKLGVFITIGFGILIAYIVARAGKSAKCRSGACLMLMGLLCGVIAVYASWVVYLYGLMNRYGSGAANVSLFQLFLSPADVWTIVETINSRGFKLNGSTLSGLTLWLAWGTEALILIGFATAMPTTYMKSWVFCEPCNRWCAEKDDIARFGAPLSGDQTEKLKAGDLTVLANLQPYAGGNTPHIRLNNRRCDTCGQTETVAIQRYWYEEVKGKSNEKSEVLTQHILLDADALTSLQNALVAQAEANAAQPAPQLTPAKKS